MKTLIFILFFLISGNAFSQGCPVPIYTQNLEDLSRVIEKGQCDPLDKETWSAEWKSPCDCIAQKNLYKKFNPTNPEEESKKLMTAIELEMEKKVAQSFRDQIYSQFEQALRLDIYLKKSIITTNNNVNNPKIGNDFKISIPTNCRLGKVGDLVNEIDEAVKNKDLASCNSENMKRRLEVLFSGDEFGEWEKKQRALVEKLSMNQLDKKEIENGMCVPYKAYLSLNNKNSFRTTYLKVAKAFGNDYLGFQNWMKDRSKSDDSYVYVAKLIKTNQEDLASVVEKLKKDFASEIQEINAEDIQKLLKTDPIFERMAHDPQFYKKIISVDSSFVNENDPKFIKLLSESQDKSCNTLYGGGLIPAKDVKAGAEKIVLKDQNLLTQFLCDDNFSKNFIDNNYIKSKMAGTLKTKLNLASLDDAEYISADYLYCKDKTPKEMPAGYLKVDPWDVNAKRVDNLPNNEPLKNLLNTILNPDSENFAPDSKAENLHKKFNQNICPYISENCRKSTAVDPKCSLSSVAVDASKKILDEKLKTDLTNEASKALRSEIDKLLVDPKVTDKELRSKLTELKSFSVDEINILLTLRQQTPVFIKDTAEKELRSILGLDKNTKIDEAFLKTLENNPKITADLKERFLNSGEKDNFLGESTQDEKSSYFSNYFSLAKKEDEEKTKKGTPYERKSFKLEEATTPNEEEKPESSPSENPPKNDDDKKKETPAPTSPSPDTSSKESSDNKEKKEEEKDNRKSKKQEIEEEDYSSEVPSNKTKSSSSKKSSSSNAEKMRQAQKKLDALNKLSAEMENNEEEEDHQVESNGTIGERPESHLNRKRTSAPRKRQAPVNNYANPGTNSFVSGGIDYKKAIPNKKKENEDNTVNPYDPFNRAVPPPVANEHRGNAAVVSNDKKTASSSGSSSMGGGSSGAGSMSSGSNSAGGSSGGSGQSSVPRGGSESSSSSTSESNEIDPDDLCGQDQELKCLFEFASIDMLSPSVQRFVEDLQLHGRSFRAVEVVRPADSKKPVKYFIHYFEPNVNLSENEKEKLFKESKKLNANYRKNKNALKEFSSTVVEVKKVEITKEEAQNMSDTILKIDGLNKLADRRARSR